MWFFFRFPAKLSRSRQSLLILLSSEVFVDQKAPLTVSKMLTRSMKRFASGTTEKKEIKLEKSMKPNVKHDNKVIVKSETMKPSSATSSKRKPEVKNEDVDTSKKKAILNREKYIGAHVSAAGGVQNAPGNASSMGAKAFGLFLRSQRQWASKPMQDETAEQFRKQCDIHGFSPNFILPHGSYLLNCGSPNEATLEKSRVAIVDELQRCEQLGLTLYNFHPGSTCGEITTDECLDRIAKTIDIAHEKTKYVITVVENMCRQGNTIGGDFSELRGIIDRVRDKSRIGVCVDTCHAFAAGYDISTAEGFESMMSEFNTIVGMNYLKAVHLNDSKGKMGCHLDRHENIGKGFIGKEGFERIVNDPRFDNMPLILETPYSGDESYAREIKLLYSLVK